jgi:DNA-binding NarL/FixJ family response regulator
MKKIKLLLLEDNRLLREGLLRMLTRQRDIKVLAMSSETTNAVHKLHRLQPDVILLDLGLRSLNSLHVVELVKKEFRQSKVILMDLAPVLGDITQFVKAGAAGFILKDATPDDFLMTIRAVADGAKVLPSVLAESLFSQIVEHAAKRGKAKIQKALRMTSREKQVIGLIGEGLTNTQIGRLLHLSSRAMKSHVHNITEKLALHSRLEIANYVYADARFKP